MSTGTITRQQLRIAIQAGIARAYGRPGFTPTVAAQLMRVADEATLVARGEYHYEADDGRIVDCPVALAFPGYADLQWDTAFTRGYDAATRAMPPVLRVTDEPQEGAGS